MKKIIRQIAVIALMLTVPLTTVNAQQVALKTNLLYDATTTPNIGMEIGVGKKHSMQVFYGLNPWKFGHGDDQKYVKHWIVNPEWRYWFCHRFNGSFIGIHAFGGQYNAANVKMPFGWWDELQDHRFEGWYAGGGISLGMMKAGASGNYYWYQLRLSVGSVEALELRGFYWRGRCLHRLR